MTREESFEQLLEENARAGTQGCIYVQRARPLGWTLHTASTLSPVVESHELVLEVVSRAGPPSCQRARCQVKKSSPRGALQLSTDC